jgi:hypothetical protein
MRTPAWSEKPAVRAQSGVGVGEEGAFFECRVLCCGAFVRREEPELLQMMQDTALDPRKHAFDVSVFEDLDGVEAGGCAAAWGLEDAVENEGEEMDAQVEREPAAPRFAPHRQSIEFDLGTTRAEPYVIGKYELTQGQVQRLGVALQAFGRAGGESIDGRDYTLRHPEESVLAPALRSWLAQNAFGLHDILGNVSERTVVPMEAGGEAFLVRGGSYMLPPLACRIGSVRMAGPNQTTPEIGVRVVRGLER